MDYASSYYVSQEDFILFHKMDRELYKILVTNLSRDPTESMQTFAMWLWLERIGFHNLVKKITTLPIILINEVVDETLTCLNIIASSNGIVTTSESNDIPLLQCIMDKEISLQFFTEKRAEVIKGVAKVGQEVCVRAFSDIMQQAMLRNAAERMVETQMAAENSLWFGTIGPSNVNYPRVVGAGAGAGVQYMMQQQNQHGHGVVPADNRTLFVTFSKGYRVEEWEVKEFFTMAYGDCIEALYMQEVQPNEQPLFARIVFHEAGIIDMIVRGPKKTKYSINGKHVWARKFVPKRSAVKNSVPNLSGGEASGSGV